MCNLQATETTTIIFVGPYSNLRDKLWEFASMDDVNYVLLVPFADMRECIKERYCYETGENVRYDAYEPADYQVEQMLQSSFSTYWTVGEIDGEKYGIGYSYHA